MKKMKILVGCEESQAVCLAFRSMGHEAYSCDLKPCSGGHPEWHLQMDIFKAIKGGSETMLPGNVLTLQNGDKIDLPNGWDMGIFFPDCTYLTCSAEWAYKDGPYHQKVKPETLTGHARRQARANAFEFFMALWNCGIPKIVMENPIGFINKFMKPTQIIHPYMFGDDASKSTCLWLKGLPKLEVKPEKYVLPRAVCTNKDCKTVEQGAVELVEKALKTGCLECGSKSLPRWGNQTDTGQNRLSPDPFNKKGIRAELRSKTYSGIAKAMAEQWGKICAHEFVTNTGRNPSYCRLCGETWG